MNAKMFAVQFLGALDEQVGESRYTPLLGKYGDRLIREVSSEEVHRIFVDTCVNGMWMEEFLARHPTLVPTQLFSDGLSAAACMVEGLQTADVEARKEPGDWKTHRLCQRGLKRSITAFLAGLAGEDVRAALESWRPDEDDSEETPSVLDVIVVSVGGARSGFVHRRLVWGALMLQSQFHTAVGERLKQIPETARRDAWLMALVRDNPSLPRLEGPPTPEAFEAILDETPVPEPEEGGGALAG